MPKTPLKWKIWHTNKELPRFLLSKTQPLFSLVHWTALFQELEHSHTEVALIIQSWFCIIRYWGHWCCTTYLSTQGHLLWPVSHFLMMALSHWKDYQIVIFLLWMVTQRSFRSFIAFFLWYPLEGHFNESCLVLSLGCLVWMGFFLDINHWQEWFFLP